MTGNNDTQRSSTLTAPTGTGREAVAVIGMSCLFPGSPDVDTYWRNILNKVDAITEPPDAAWDPAVYYDSTFADTDKVYCQRGGYLGDLVSFDPLDYGVPPLSVGGEPDQWLALELAYAAMADAGCTDLPEEIRHRTAVVLGKGTYLNGGNATAIQRSLIVGQTLEVLKQMHPEMSEADIEALREEMQRVLPPMGSEMVAGLIPNIIVGRIANRLDLMGPTYTVDAACASSLVALQLAVRDLLNGECDLALAGGSQVWMPVPALNVFCRLGALSPRQQIRPFDKDADGTLLGEGIGMVVLKRLSDAERDGDRIYSVIKGVGVASDGRGLSVMAPRVDGEELALRRAYAEAGVSPSSVGLIEAHGTATPVGDVVEVEALSRVFGPRSGELPYCALGTVKSMISHTIPAAGVAGLIKTSLALYHKVLPPTLNCEEPNPKLNLEHSSFYINTETRPWIHAGPEPRRAGINAFGFGGINAHAVLEEYRGTSESSAHAAPVIDYKSERPPTVLDHLPDWETEVCILESDTPSGLRARALELAGRLDLIPTVVEPSRGTSAPYELADIAMTVNAEVGASESSLRLAIVATSIADLQDKLQRAAERLTDPECRQIKDVAGIYYAAEPLGREGKLAFLFPGEGAQYQNMLSDLCLQFPEVRETFDRVDRIFVGDDRAYQPSDYVFPRPAFTEDARRTAQERLMQMDSAIEAVLTANLAVFGLTQRLGLEPDAIVGHSTGEYSAAYAAGVLDLDTEERLSSFSRALNTYYRDAASQGNVPRAVLLAIGADRDTAEAIADEAGGDVFVAIDNCPHQAVLIGDTTSAGRARQIAERDGLIFEELTYDRAVHTPLFAPFTDPLRQIFADVAVRPARTPLYSCTTSAPYPTDPAAIRELFIEHWTAPVEFRRTVEELYDQGFRIFVEVGPRGNLTAFVQDILRGREFVAAPANVQRRSGVTQLNHLVGILASQGVNMDVGFLYAHRTPRHVSWEDLAQAGAPSARKTRIQLATGWPMLRLSQEVVDNVRKSNAVPVPASAEGLHGSQPAGGLCEGEAVAGSGHNWVPDSGSASVLEQPPVSRQPGSIQVPADAWFASEGEDEVSGIVDAYLETMGQFLTAQEEVLEAYLSGAHTSNVPEEASSATWRDVTPIATLSGNGALDVGNGHADVDTMDVGHGAVADARYPLLGSIVSLIPGQELTARRTFSLSNDLYLRDHTLGRNISRTDPELTALAVMPLTMSLEILAEAAACLIPDQMVIGLRDVRAQRWIAWDEDAQELEVSAWRVESGTGMATVQVQLRNLTEDLQAPELSKSPVIEATVLLGVAYDPAPEVRMADLSDAGPSAWEPARLYQDGGMFHGPRWQGVAGIEQTGAGGSVARLVVQPCDGFLRGAPAPEYVIDPVTLDAAGQVIGYWTAEHLATANVIFPFRLDSLDIYAPQLPAGESVTCFAATRLIGDQLVDSDIDLLTADGQLWMRLTGWADKRFELPAQFRAALVTSNSELISFEWPEPVAHLLNAMQVQCRLVAAAFPSDRAFWKRVWAQRVLARSEREQFAALRTPEVRQLEWLGARTAAKEGLRRLLLARFGLDLLPADIVIDADEAGRPIVDGAWIRDIDVTPLVSLAHTQGTAVALTALGRPGDAIGIDIEFLRERPAGFKDIAFTDAERALLAGLPAEIVEEWTLRCWCAKESVAKAAGSGLTDGPRSVSVTEIDLTGERVITRLAGTLAQEHPELATREIISYTTRSEDLVAAVAVIERAAR